MIAHDPSFVILSMAIAILGAFTTCVMTSNIGALEPAEKRARLAMASVALGGSLWAMQFVGLLGLAVPSNFARYPALLALSAVIALMGAAVSLFLAGGGEPGRPRRLPVATVVLGTVIAGMNYTAILSIAGRGFSLLWFLVAVGLAVSLQVAAIVLWFLFRRRGVLLTIAGSIVLGLCLSATHYLAIASTENLKQAVLASPAHANAISAHYLAWSAAIMTYMICSICLCIFVVGLFHDEA